MFSGDRGMIELKMKRPQQCVAQLAEHTKAQRSNLKKNMSVSLLLYGFESWSNHEVSTISQGVQ